MQQSITRKRKQYFTSTAWSGYDGLLSNRIFWHWRRRTFREIKSSDNSRKWESHSFHDPGQSRVYTKKIEEPFAISREREGYTIIHKILDIRKLSAKWVPKHLNADQKSDRVIASQVILDRFQLDPVGLLNHLVIMDETWIPVRIWFRDLGAIQGLETQWFLVSKGVQDTEDIKQGIGVCLLEQIRNFACTLFFNPPLFASCTNTFSKCCEITRGMKRSAQ
jgi:hypothetical protein